MKTMEGSTTGQRSTRVAGEFPQTAAVLTRPALRAQRASYA
jgi:hypothetical protein